MRIGWSPLHAWILLDPEAKPLDSHGNNGSRQGMIEPEKSIVPECSGTAADRSPDRCTAGGCSTHLGSCAVHIAPIRTSGLVMLPPPAVPVGNLIWLAADRESGDAVVQ
jgi:hypothetical protein